MKSLFFSLFILFSLNINGQNSVVEMTPYEVTDEEAEMFEEMGVPEELYCKIQTCPEKLRARGTNLFSLIGTNLIKKNIKMRPRYARKLKSGSKIYAFVVKDQVSFFKVGKGFVRKMNSMDVFVTK